MLEFGLSILFLLGFLYCLQSLTQSYGTVQKVIIDYLIGSAYIVVTLELASFVSSLNKPWVILSIQAVLTLLAGIFFRNRIAPPKIHLSKAFAYVKQSFKQHPFLMGFTCLIGVFYVFLFFISIQFPQNTSDALYNHLSRIGYWLQQGSLKTYTGFNDVGLTYPLNNSLLMLWSVVFIKSDILVGSVQLTATIITALTINSMSQELGFSRKSGLLSSLIFLTFPIVLLESITAQNDILAASYIAAAFLFLLNQEPSRQKSSFIYSALAISLALGTKQYTWFIFPGYLLLALTRYLKSAGRNRNLIIAWIGSMIGFSIMVGLFSYARNWIDLGSPLGSVQEVNVGEITQGKVNFAEKIKINSLRLVTQFLSCDGFSQMTVEKCIQMKQQILIPSVVNLIESGNYLLEPETPFKLTNRYPLNEESAWYGALGWILILPGFVYGIIYSIKTRKPEGIVLILSSLLLFFIVSSFKEGWDLYLGRYLIGGIALLMPFTSILLNGKQLYSKLIIPLICITAIFIMLYTITNDDSRPLLGKNQLYQWSENGSLLVKKVTYKTLPYVVHDKSLWGESRSFQRAYNNQFYLDGMDLVDTYVPVNGSLGIAAKEGYFLDYLFFGENFTHKLFPIKNGDISSQPQFNEISYILVSPEYPEFKANGFFQAAEKNGWRILQKEQANGS